MKRAYLNLKMTVLLVALITATGFSQNSPTMVSVEGGSFTMGSNVIVDVKEDKDKAPAHKVKVRSFDIGQHEVTVAQYKKFVAATGKKMPPKPDAEWLDSHEDTKKFYPTISNPFWGWKAQFPMHHVSWYDAIAYCNWLSAKNGLAKVYTKNADGGWDTDLTKKGYRLPTEAEWEFAARGGNKSKGTDFSGSSNASSVAWYDETTKLSGPKKVKTKAPNELGIYDMSGNVWEWCSDYYNANYYKSSPADNPFNSSSSPSRVLRGGGWHYKAHYAQVTSRDGPYPHHANYNTGFRLARTK